MKNENVKKDHLGRLSATKLRIAIAELERLDLRSVDIHVIKRYLKRITPGHFCLTRENSGPWFYRVRFNEGDDFYSHVRDLWHPRPEHLTKYGRANHPGSPLLYCSANKDIAINELDPAEGQVLTVLVCGLRDRDKPLRNMELGLAERCSALGIQDSYTLPSERHLAAGLTAADLAKNHIVRSFLSRSFLTRINPGEEHRYKLSVAIADFLLDSDWIDGIEYLSAACGLSETGVAPNVAIKPTAADTKLYPHSCFVSRVEHRFVPTTRDQKYQLRCIKNARAILPNWEIVWD